MKHFFVFLFLTFSIAATAQLKINEIMSDNVSAVLDDSYNYSMWVELYNPSSTTSINQSAYFFTDNLSQPRKWHPASKLIIPGGFSLLWFERDDRAGHANFKLEPNGGKLYLLNFFSQVVDSVVYAEQYRNISYGRKIDGSDEWVFFEQYSAGSSNNNKTYASLRCSKPVFKLAGGIYSTGQDLSFETPNPGEKIYFSINGSEPTTNNTYYIPGSILTLRNTAFIRAKSFCAGKLSSDIATATYFIGERRINLPIVSIVTDNANLNDNKIGLYVAGTNGISGNGSNVAVNWNQDWDRPVNFELFDTTKVSRINQELDISISGGWSRLNPQKSLKISPRKKFGDSKLQYDFFKTTKPGLKYRDIQMRNSGNDFYYSMMRDAFMVSLAGKRMDVDYLAYEPAVMYMNGVYFGIQNLRETSGKDFIYSNYGLDDDEINLLESWAIPNDTSYLPLSNYISQNDISQANVYNKVCEMMDMDNFMDYMISEIYYGNTDWPNNNVKIWKKKAGGKWRWILYDTDFGFNLFDTSLFNHNSLLYALGEKTDKIPDAWSTLLLRRLILNATFRNKFVDKFCINLSTTFETTRVNAIMDSIAAKIATEIVYHKAKWTSYRNFNEDIINMKTFSANRPGNMLNFINNRFVNAAAIQSVHLFSDVPRASYNFNNETVHGSDVVLKYFKNSSISIAAKPLQGYLFKQWESSVPSTIDEITMGSDWKYFDGNAVPAVNWASVAYNDANWKGGKAQLGYGGKGEVTTIGYGGVSTNKYITAYFRKTISISNLNSKSNFILTALVDDGAAIYVNGTEVGRYLLPTGTLTFNTLSTNYNNGDLITYSVPQSLLKEGGNLIAVEVHQTSATSSDLIFDLKLTCHTNVVSQVYTSSIYSALLEADVNLKAVYEKSNIVNPDDSTTIVFNELVASNNLISDEFGEKDDYIELYNRGSKDVNIAGWYLTDSPINRILTRIPTTDSIKTNIPAKGRIILWADDERSQGVLHLGFKLGKEGESILLSRLNLYGFVAVVDSVCFPAMDQNLSYSRVPDGSTNWIIQATTFDLTNDWLSAVETAQDKITRIYPTLVTNEFTIQNALGRQVTVNDLTGKILYRAECHSESEIVQVGFLQQGLYVVKIGNNTYKIVKL